MMEAGHFNRSNGHANGKAPVNNTGLPDHQFQQLLEVVHNASTARQEWFQRLFDPHRNIEEECGLPQYGSGIPVDYYKNLYDRFGIANKVVTVMPKECFQRSPRVWEDEGNKRNTPFELAWDALGSKINTGGGPSWHLDETGSPIWEHVQRADALSRIGKFGIILLGFNDGKDLAAPVDGVLKTPDWVADDSELDQLEGRGTGSDGKQRKGLPGLTDREKGVISNLRHEGAMIRNAVSKMSQGMQPSDRAKTLDGSDFLDAQGSFGGSYGTAGGQSPSAPWGGYGPQSHLGTDAQYYGVQFGPTEELSLKPAKKGVKLMFMRPYDESLVQIVRYEWNILSPRFGMPIMYRVTLNDPRTQSSGIGLPLSTVFVHWSRVIHLADVHHTPCSSEIFAYPAMQPVLDNLLGLRKLYSAAPEAYWKTCLPIWSLETHPQLGGDVRVNTSELKDTLEQVFEGLQRYLITTGMEVKTVASQPGDPTQQIAVQLEAICIQIGMPMRVFKGSERGELASSQDDSKWNDVIRNRQNLYLTPRVIIPLVDRLIMVGVLPEPGKQGAQQAVTNARRRGQWVIEKPDGFLILNAVDPRFRKRVPVAPLPATEEDDAETEAPADEEGPAEEGVPQGEEGAEAGAQGDGENEGVSDADQDVQDDVGVPDVGSAEVDAEDTAQDAGPAVQGAEGGQDEGQVLADGMSSGPDGGGNFGGGSPHEPFVDAAAAGPVPASALRGAKFVSKAGYTIEWPDLESLGDADKATIAGSKMTALQTYVGQGAAPSTKMTDLDFWTRIMGMEEEEAQEIIDAAILQQQMDKAEAQAQADAAGHVPSPPPGFEKPDGEDKGKPTNKIGPGESAVDPNTGKITAVSPHAPPQGGDTHVFPGGAPAPAADQPMPGQEQQPPDTGPLPFQPHETTNAYRVDNEWSEDQHPRGEDGRFGAGGGVAADYPVSEACSTVLSNLAKQARANESAVLSQIATLPDEDHDAIVKGLRDLYEKSDLTVNFVARRMLPDGRTMIDHLLEDPQLHNLHETGTGGGTTDDHIRSIWESNSFGAVHEDASMLKYGPADPDVTPTPKEDMPKYGSLNVTGDKEGGASNYGATHFVLDKEYLKDRLTFTPDNSSGTGKADVATAEHPLAAMAKCNLGVSRLPDAQRREVEDNVPQQYAAYLEAQIWGPVPLNSKTVKKIRVYGHASSSDDINKLQELGRKIGVPVEVF